VQIINYPHHLLFHSCCTPNESIQLV